MTATLTDLFGPVIHAYTRADAIADGQLIEVPEHLATEAGLRLPVALTCAAWADCVAWDETDNSRKGALQDEDGRLWDVLYMTRIAATRARGTDRAVVELYRVPRSGTSVTPRKVRLVAHIGPGDHAEPVLTISLPGED